MAVKSVKVWKKRGEIRVYVKNDKGFESVEFVTGNNWNKAGSRKKQGRFGIKAAEWQEAEELAKVGGEWQNYNYQTSKPRSNNRNGYRCPDCHSPYCTGPNCDSNYPRS